MFVPRFIELLKSENKKTIKNLSIYVFKSLKKNVMLFYLETIVSPFAMSWEITYMYLHLVHYIHRVVFDVMFVVRHIN